VVVFVFIDQAFFLAAPVVKGNDLIGIHI